MRSSFLLIFALPMTALALPTGINGYSGKMTGTTCTACHTANGATAPTLAITGPAALTAGMTGNYTLTITGGPAKGAGADLALGGVNSGGATFTAGPGAKLVSGEVVHTAPGAFIANAATFTFSVKAPLTAGVFTVFAAGLSSNNDTGTTGDGTGSTSLDVTVSLTSGSPPVGGMDGGGVPPPVLPGADAGTGATPPVTPAADGGTTPPVTPPASSPDAGSGTSPVAPAQIPTSTGGHTAPLSDGVIEGEGCSSAGGSPLLGLFALVALVRVRRSRR